MIVHRFVSQISSVIIVAGLAACGSSPPPAASNAASSDAKAAPAPATAEEHTTSATAPKPDAPKGAKGGLTEEKLHESKALGEAFPEIDAVTKELGAPFAKGKATRREWYFEKNVQKTHTSCSTIDLMRGPGGRTVVDTSVYTGKECNAIKLTKANVAELLATISGQPAQKNPMIDSMAKDIQSKPFDQTSAAFEKKAGKPQETAEPDFAAWKYQTDGEEGECRLVMVTKHAGSGAGQALWDLPCQ